MRTHQLLITAVLRHYVADAYRPSHGIQKEISVRSRRPNYFYKWRKPKSSQPSACEQTFACFSRKPHAGSGHGWQLTTITLLLLFYESIGSQSAAVALKTHGGRPRLWPALYETPETSRYTWTPALCSQWEVPCLLHTCTVVALSLPEVIMPHLYTTGVWTGRVQTRRRNRETQR